jgi:hypothetical protein
MKTEYELIPMSEITPEARKIAVAWIENYTPYVSLEIAQKHKLASDIQNYASTLNREVLEENEKLKAALNDLVDVQNGPPLVRDTDQWNEIMERCYKLLSESSQGTKPIE